MSECGGFQPIHSKNISGDFTRTFQVHCITVPTLGKVDALSVSTAETSMQKSFKALNMHEVPHGRHRRVFFCGISDTDGVVFRGVSDTPKPAFLLIATRTCSKNGNCRRVPLSFMMKKTETQKSRDTVPLKGL